MFLGGLRRWYNPPWYTEMVPSGPYDPLVLRKAFEKACSGLTLISLTYYVIFFEEFYLTQ